MSFFRDLEQKAENVFLTTENDIKTFVTAAKNEASILEDDIKTHWANHINDLKSLKDEIINRRANLSNIVPNNVQPISQDQAPQVPAENNQTDVSAANQIGTPSQPNHIIPNI